jgi:hypothetical protein
MEGLDLFIDFVRKKYGNSSEIILSNLVEKGYKYHKFKTCKLLLSKNIKIYHFNTIVKMNR